MTQAYEQMASQLGTKPQLIIVHSSVTYDSPTILNTLKCLAPGIPVHGGTSCLGVMTDQGFHCENDKGLALIGISDPEGSYGVGAAELSQGARTAAYSASEKALLNAQRQGETPSMVWVMAAPGQEEEVLLGIADLFGPNVPISGGSSADNTISGQWKQFAHDQVYANSVVVSVMFASTGVVFSFHSGYDPTDTKAVVVKGFDRTIQELDGRPAADVYNEWIGGGLNAELVSGGNILMKSSLHPLGRIVGSTGGIPYFQLSHPDSVTADRGMTMFSDVQQGDQMYLMHGSHESLIHRAERVVASALRSGDLDSSKIAGALIIYCAGCMLTVKDRIPEVIASFKKGLGSNTPFLGAFTFGEQGCFLGGENRHGNLMISVLVFLK